MGIVWDCAMGIDRLVRMTSGVFGVSVYGDEPSRVDGLKRAAAFGFASSLGFRLGFIVRYHYFTWARQCMFWRVCYFPMVLTQSCLNLFFLSFIWYGYLNEGHIIGSND